MKDEYCEGPPPQQQMPFIMGQTPMEQMGQNITKLTNPHQIIESIELNLRGLKKWKGELIKFRQIPYMNEEGINDVMGLVHAHISQNTVMSNLSDREIKGIMRLLVYTLGKMLMLNRKKYSIAKTEDRTTIMDIILIPCFVCLKRPFEQGERRFLKGAVYEQYLSMPDYDKSKTGLGKILNPFGKK